MFLQGETSSLLAQFVAPCLVLLLVLDQTRESRNKDGTPASQPLPPSLVQLEGDKGSRSPPRDLEAAGTETKILVELEEIHSRRTSTMTKLSVQVRAG